MKLQTKTIIFLIIIIIIVSLSSLLVFSSQFIKHSLNRMLETGDYIATNLALETIDHLYYESYQSLDEVVSVHASIPDILTICILDAQNQVVASSDLGKIGLINDELPEEGALVIGREIRIVRSVELYEQKLGSLILIFSTDRLYDSLRSVLQTWIYLMLFLLIAAVILAYYFITRFLKPLKKILNMTNAVSEGTFSGKEDAVNSYELDLIVKALNTMAEAVLEREEKNRIVTKEKTELSEYLSSMIDSMSMVIFGLDKQGCIIHWNNKDSALLEVPDDNLYGKKLTGLLRKPYISDDLVGKVILEKSKEIVKGVIVEIGSETFYFDIYVLPLLSDVHFGAVVLIEDISERKRFQELLVQSEKMLSIGGMAAGMAHEINNPLAGIMQNAHTLERRLKFNTPACDKALSKFSLDKEIMNLFFQERQFLTSVKYIHESGKRISTIISDMLNYAKKSDNSFSTSSLQDLMDKSVTLALNDTKGNSRINFSDIEIIRDYCESPVEIYCTPNKIIQVLLNILKNGAEAMFEVQTKPIFRLKILTIENWGIVEIEDNGPGVPPDKMKYIFDPFFSTKKEAGGTGLGMSISYFIIVDQHRGKLEVKSDGKNGAKFIISLPLN